MVVLKTESVTPTQTASVTLRFKFVQSIGPNNPVIDMSIDLRNWDAMTCINQGSEPLCACVRACVRACLRTYVRVFASVFAFVFVFGIEGVFTPAMFGSFN